MRYIYFFLFLAVFLCSTFFVWQKLGPKQPTAKQQEASAEPVLHVDSSNLFLSPDGSVLGTATSAKPELFLLKDTKLALGQKVKDAQILFAANLAKQLVKSDFSVASLRLLDSGDIAVYNQLNAIAIFSQNKDLSSEVDSLQKVLAKAKIDATKILKIDLRFDQPVITFK